MNFHECHNCDYRDTCPQTPEACQSTEHWTRTDTYALVKAAEETLASAMEAGELRVGLCCALLGLRLAIKPFQEEQRHERL